MNPFGFAAIGIFVTSLSMCILLLIKGDRTRLNFIWIIYTFCASVWGFMAIFISNETNYDISYTLWRIGYMAIIPVPALFLHFVSELLKLKRKFLVKIIYIFTSFVALVNIIKPKLLLGELRFVFNQFYWTYNPGPILHLYTVVCVIGVIVYCHYELFRAYKYNSDVSIKNKIVYFLIGSILGWAGVILTFLTNYFHGLYPYGHFLIMFYPPILTYAIIKYRLMDVNIILRKGLVYSVLVAVITAFYSLFVLVIGEVFRGVVGYQSFIFNICVIFLLALVFNPLKDWVQHILDRRLFHGTLESLEREGQRLKQELFQAEKLAYVGQLASSVVHEVRNPLATIKTYLEYLPQKYNQPEFKNKFERLIPQEISRLEKIVNQLLGLARQRKLVLQKLDVTGLIDNTIDLLENNFKAKDIRIVKQYDAGTSIEGDQEQLKQVFLNLFLNAIQAMEEGGVLTLSVRNKADVSSNPAVEITIHDTGCGIPYEQLKQLFKPFQTTKEDGIGLGLSITREIIEQHNGTITVDSIVGQGTTFTITLPGCHDDE